VKLELPSTSLIDISLSLTGSSPCSKIIYTTSEHSARDKAQDISNNRGTEAKVKEMVKIESQGSSLIRVIAKLVASAEAYGRVNTESNNVNGGEHRRGYDEYSRRKL
jgi:hypothetical protein